MMQFCRPRGKTFDTGPKQLGIISEHDRKNLPSFPEKIFFFSQKVPLDTQNAVWQSCPKIFDKIPKTFISLSKSNKKTFQKNFSSKCIPLFGMQFWRIRMKKFNNGRDMARCPKMMKKHICFYGHAEYIFDNTVENFWPEVGDFFLNVRNRWRKRFIFQNEKHSSPNCAPGRLECHSEDCAKTFCKERPKFFVHCTKGKKSLRKTIFSKGSFGQSKSGSDTGYEKFLAKGRNIITKCQKR